jgi:2-dehydro-3-deoxygalactonokinase
MKNSILCCDWGTSFFRLALLTINDYQLIGEVHSKNGIVQMFNDWQETGSPVSGKPEFFQAELKKQIVVLGNKLFVDMDHIPILLSGMASSSIGMEEIPYADLPFALDGSNANIKWFEPTEEFPHQVMLVSGVKSPKDVMRGEETQLIGIIEKINMAEFSMPKSVFIFPGTHSKHIYMDEAQLVDIKTYMTGELFGLIANASILKDSVDAKLTIDLSADEREAFRSGVREAQLSNMLYGLFTVRTNQLFDKLGKTQNYFYLSGLLIGTELKHLRKREELRVILCSSSKLQLVYKLAIEELHMTNRCTIIPATIVDKAAYVGQVSLFKKQNIVIDQKQ